MNAVLLSVKPESCELMASGRRTFDIRKTKPKLETPFKVYIYCTKDKPILGKYSIDNSLKEYLESDFDYYNRDTLFRANGKVIGEFICDYTLGRCNSSNADIAEQYGFIKREKLFEYAKGKELFGWHISNLIIYDKPRDLIDFCNTDLEAIKQCKYRERVYINPIYTNNALLPGSYICNQRDAEWCAKCKMKPIVAPPQSWCYVQERVELDEV